MCSPKTKAFAVLVITLCGAQASAIEGYILGAGLDADSEDGLTATLVADVGLTEKTWLSAAYARNRGDLSTLESLRTQLADVSIDHWFDPIGLRLGAAYWGDSDVLDSDDVKASIYWRGKSSSITLNVEQREFEFDIFRNIALPQQDIKFSADGLGLSGRFGLSDAVDIRFSGTRYDYDVDLRRAANRPIARLLSATRLSLINSLIDHRARVGLSIDRGDKEWGLDYATWQGAVDGATTHSYTARLISPLSTRFDMELALGVDDSELYGSVTVFTVFLYFYGD